MAWAEQVASGAAAHVNDGLKVAKLACRCDNVEERVTAKVDSRRTAGRQVGAWGQINYGGVHRGRVLDGSVLNGGVHRGRLLDWRRGHRAGSQHDIDDVEDAAAGHEVSGEDGAHVGAVTGSERHCAVTERHSEGGAAEGGKGLAIREVGGLEGALDDMQAEHLQAQPCEQSQSQCHDFGSKSLVINDGQARHSA